MAQKSHVEYEVSSSEWLKPPEIPGSRWKSRYFSIDLTREVPSHSIMQNLTTIMTQPTLFPIPNLPNTRWNPQAIYGIVFGILTIVLGSFGVLIALRTHETGRAHAVDLRKSNPNERERNELKYQRCRAESFGRRKRGR